MKKDNCVLPRALGRALSNMQGLARLSLPSTMDPRLLVMIAAEANGKRGEDDFAHVVRPEKFEKAITSEDAIRLRSRDDGTDATALLVHLEGEFKQLKSLEGFRPVNPDGLPSGLAGVKPSELSLDSVIAEVPGLVGLPAQSAASAKLIEALRNISTFLAASYSQRGNEEITWIDAWWRHLDIGLAKLPVALQSIPSAHGAARETFACYAAFGLPYPDNVFQSSYSSRNDGKAYASIVAARWSTYADIEVAILDIRDQERKANRLGPEENHPLVQLGWENVATTRSSLGHSILATCFQGLVGRHWLEAWASTGESSFFVRPATEGLGLELCRVTENTNCPLPTVPNLATPVYLARLSDEHVDRDYIASVGQFAIVLGSAGVQPDRVSINVHAKPSTLTAREVQTLERNGELWVTFELSLKLKGGNWRDQPYEIVLTPTSEEAKEILRGQQSVGLVIPMPKRTGAFVLERANLSGPAKLCTHSPTKYECKQGGVPTPLDKEDESAPVFKLGKSTRDFQVFVTGQAAQPSLGAKGVVQPLKGAEIESGEMPMFLGGPVPPADAWLVAGEFEAEIRAAATAVAHLSPFTACASGEQLAADIDGAVEEELRRDPRSLIEQWLADDLITNKEPIIDERSLGIVAIRAGDEGSLSLPEFDDANGYYKYSKVLPRVSLAWEETTEAARNGFWRAFKELDLGKLAVGSSTLSAWPSRLDLRGLEKDRLVAYLAAFKKLVETASAHQPSGLLAFPFSVLVFDKFRGELEGILLSPLHPLRLGWSWSIQNAANDALQTRNSGEVRDFLRFCDGSGFPFLTPSPGDTSYLLSAPLDTGRESVFAPWSFLASSNVTRMGTSVLGAILGRRFPTGATSGLDKGGVTSALRDFLRVNPHLTQINAGIFASSEVERSRELDSAIVEAISEAIGRLPNQLPGGARIYDSPMRNGSAPEPEFVIATMEKARANGIGGQGKQPFEWRIDERRGVDLRFLETSLVLPTVEARQVADEGGTGPELPIKRYVTWARSFDGTLRSSYCPIVPAESFASLPGYAKCLRLVETMQPANSLLPQVSCQLLQTPALLDDPARWTVAGNSNIDPATLARELSMLSRNLMLWEWRPAVLPRSKSAFYSAVATARPYVTISRLDPYFATELDNELVASVGNIGPEGHKAVLAELGTRGIGLSSLLSIGHQQTTGAIGFYLAYRAIRAWELEAQAGEIRCLLPMDAINPVLEAIAGDETGQLDRRRADVLAVRSIPQGNGHYHVLFHPIEVKMRKYDGVFAEENDTEIRRALGQLANSVSLLTNLSRAVGQQHEPLLFNAVASLLEAALAMRANLGEKRTHEDLTGERDLLSAVANGRVKLEVSAGTLFWFQSGGADKAGNTCVTRKGDLGSPWQVLANPLHLGAALTSAVPTDVQRHFIAAIDRDCVSQEKLVTQETKEPVEETVPVRRNVIASTQPKKDQAPAASAEARGEPPVEVTVEPPMEQESILSEFSVHIGDRPLGLREEPIVFDPGDTSITQLNIGVIGDLGTGKTQFLRSLVYQLSQNKVQNGGTAPKFLIFDYKQDYIDEQFVSAIGGKLLSPGRSPIPLNFFALPKGAPRRAKILRAMFFADVVDRINNIGEVQREKLKESVVSAYEELDGTGYPLIGDVLDKYREATTKADVVTSALTSIVDLEIFENDRDNILSFEDLFDTSVIVDLKGIGAGNKVQDIIVTLFLDLVYSEYMPTREKELKPSTSGGKRRIVDSFVLVDEAHHIMEHGFEVLNTLLLEGRQFGMGVILSSQYLSHFRSGGFDWAQPLSTWSIHRVPNIQARDLVKLGFGDRSEQLAREIPRLAKHHSIIRLEPNFGQGLMMKDKPYFSFFD